MAMKDNAKGEDITVLIPCRNRADHRLKNCLNTLKCQDYPSHLINIKILDYSSAEKYSEVIAKYAKLYNVGYAKIYNKHFWSKPNCVNIGVKSSYSQYLMVSDMDFLFHKNYISSAVSELKKNKQSVVCSTMYDIPENMNSYLIECAQKNITPDMDIISKVSCKRCPQYYNEYHPSAICVRTIYYKYIKGYDEYYSLWGCEDDDLIKRFIYLGLKIQSIKDKSHYYHQWHRKHEGVSEEKELEKTINRNREYYNKSNTIFRNARGWGE
jgi:hypothetical protein